MVEATWWVRGYQALDEILLHVPILGLKDALSFTFVGIIVLVGMQVQGCKQNILRWCTLGNAEWLIYFLGQILNYSRHLSRDMIEEANHKFSLIQFSEHHPGF